MAEYLIQDLLLQYFHTFRIITEEINRFSEEEWKVGISFFQVPVKQAMHLLDCLDFYFSDNGPDEYKWGYRFGGGWWEIPEDNLPDKKDILDYAGEIKEKIVSQLSTLDDSALSETSPIQYEWVKTRLGLYIYALRHTLHHHGQLSALAVHHSHQGGSWE